MVPAAAAGETSLNSSEVVWHDISELVTLPYDETYSYDEMYYLLSNEGYSDDEINKILRTTDVTTRSNPDVEIRYARVNMDEHVFEEDYILEARFNVGLEYRGNNYMPSRIVSVGGARVYTGAGADCVFTGDVFYRLINGQSFYNNFYGDIYKQGVINWELGLQIGIGEFFSVNASISNSSGFIENVDVGDTYYSAALNP